MIGKIFLLSTVRKILFYTPSLYSGRVLWFHVGRPCVCPSVCRWIFTEFGMCIDIVQIWFGIAYGQILTELSAQGTPIFSFPDDNLCKRQWIFTKLGMCIDIVEIWIGIANRQIS